MHATSSTRRKQDHGQHRSSPIIKLSRGSLVSSSPVPAYHRLEVQIRELIERGAFEPNEQLPSEYAIADHLHVSRPTVRQALKRLEKAHLIRREHGNGTFVEPGPVGAWATGHGSPPISLIRTT